MTQLTHTHLTHTLLGRDGARLTYDVQGYGPGLVLLHGLSQYRTLWNRYGWVDALAPSYTVITPDFRGAGDSVAPQLAEAHAFEQYLGDFEAILDDLGLSESLVWGWSFGANVALRLAARSTRITAAIASGTGFGRGYSPEFVRARLADLDRFENARKTGDWAGITETQRATAELTDFAASRVRLQALADWPAVEPSDLKRPALILTGTEDPPAAALQEHRAEIEAAGIGLHLFDGLNHLQLVSERDIVFPWVKRFLHEQAIPRPVGSGHAANHI